MTMSGGITNLHIGGYGSSRLKYTPHAIGSRGRRIGGARDLCVQLISYSVNFDILNYY